MKKAIRIACGIAAVIAFIFLFAECDTLNGTIATKAVALALLTVSAKGYEKTMTAEEWEEKA